MSRVALVVDASPNNDDLPPGEQLATQIEKTLLDPNVGDFDSVVALRCPGIAVLRSSLERTFAQLSSTDEVLCHFVCAVTHSDQSLYLKAADTDENRLQSTAIELRELNRMSLRSPSRQQAIILDIHWAPNRVGAMRTWLESRNLRVLASESSFHRTFAVSTCAFQRADFSFSAAWAKGLTAPESDRNGDGWVTVDELVAYASSHMTATDKQPSPRLFRSRRGAGELAIATAAGGSSVSRVDGLASLGQRGAARAIDIFWWIVVYALWTAAFALPGVYRAAPTDPLELPSLELSLIWSLLRNLAVLATVVGAELAFGLHRTHATPGKLAVGIRFHLPQKSPTRALLKRAILPVAVWAIMVLSDHLGRTGEYLASSIFILVLAGVLLIQTDLYHRAPWDLLGGTQVIRK